MTREEEHALLMRAQQGDGAAFEEIVRAHEATVYHLALRQLGNREDAEDAAQEVFLKAYTSLAGFRGDSKLSVWLYRITNNVCIDFLRRRARCGRYQCEKYYFLLHKATPGTYHSRYSRRGTRLR